MHRSFGCAQDRLPIPSQNADGWMGGAKRYPSPAWSEAIERTLRQCSGQSAHY